MKPWKINSRKQPWPEYRECTEGTLKALWSLTQIMSSLNSLHRILFLLQEDKSTGAPSQALQLPQTSGLVPSQWT